MEAVGLPAVPPTIKTLPCARLARGTPEPTPLTEGDPLQLSKRSAEQRVLIWLAALGVAIILYTHTHTHTATDTTVHRQELDCRKQFPVRVPCPWWPSDHFPSPGVPSTASMGCIFHNKDKLLETDSHFPALGMCWGWGEAWENSRVMKLLYSLMMVANTHLYLSAKTQRTIT